MTVPKNLDSVYRLRDLQRAFNDHLRDLIARVKKRKKKPKRDEPGKKPQKPSHGGGDFRQLGSNQPNILVEQGGRGGGHDYHPPSLADCLKKFTGNDKFDIMGRLGCKCKFGDKHACEQLSQMMATEHPQSGGGSGGGF